MEFMTIKELQDALDVSRNTAYDLIHRGVIPSIRVGRAYRIPKELFDAWVVQEVKTKTKNK